MIYVGSKARFKKYIVPIINKYVENNNIKSYIEPFVGGANIIDDVICFTKTGFDIDEDVINIYEGVQQGWTPPLHISEELYTSLRHSSEKSFLRSYVSFAGSYASKKWGGVARGFKADKITPRDIYNERTRNFIKQIPKLLGIRFKKENYPNILVPDNSLIYCDPPYYGTTKYANKGFSHEKFWRWVDDMSKNNIVLVSEFTVPLGSKVIWERSRACSLTKATGDKNRIEKLVVYGDKI